MSQLGIGESFSDELINSVLDEQQAASEITKIAGRFAEQMWHDLFEQNHLQLQYSQADKDWFAPVGFDKTPWQTLDKLSPGKDVSWINKNDGWALTFDYESAHQLAEGSDADDFYDDPSGYIFNIVDEPFIDELLALAIGAGIQFGDLKVLDAEKYDQYLYEKYRAEPEMYVLKVEVRGETPWTGVRYRDLKENQQVHLVTNLAASMNSEELGGETGVATHLLNCMAAHDQTAESVKAFIGTKVSG